MTDQKPASKPTLDDFVALNDEIAALTRAGMPLETGLRGFAGSVSGKLSSASARLSDRLSAGMSLTDALDAEATGLPRVYRAIIAAGAESGCLSEALESVAGHARALQDLRRQISLAWIYPALLLAAAYYLFWIFIGEVVASFGDLSRLHGVEPTGWLSIVETVWRGIDRAGHIPPGVLLLLLIWWYVSSRFVSPGGGLGSAGLRYIPGIGRSLTEFRLATFCELSGALMSHGVPAPRALRLAGDASGDSRIAGDAARTSDRLERGESLDEALGHTSFPPSMRWMLQLGSRQGSPAATFRQLGATYTTRAQSRAEWFKLWFPVVLTLIVGGGVVLLYTLSLFVPLSELLDSLAAESPRT